MFLLQKYYYLREKFRGNFPESIYFYSVWLWKLVHYCQPVVFFPEVYSNIFIGSLLCSKAHGIYILFCYGMDNMGQHCTSDYESSAILLWSLFRGGSPWGILDKRVVPPNPWPTTPSLRRDHGVEDLSSSPNTKPDISLHCKMLSENSLHSSDVKCCGNTSQYYHNFLREHSGMYQLE